MATNFPASLDALTNPTSSDSLSSPSHSAQHANVNDAVEALQAKVGADSSAVTTSLDYKVAQLEAQGTWTAYTPTFTGISFSSYTARYAMVNKVVHVGFEGTLDAASTGTIYIGLPETPYLPNNDTRRWGAASCVDQSAGVYYSGLVELRSTGEVRIWDNVGGSSSAPRWDNLFPFTWASGDWLTFQITYEAA